MPTKKFYLGKKPNYSALFKKLHNSINEKEVLDQVPKMLELIRSSNVSRKYPDFRAFSFNLMHNGEYAIIPYNSGPCATNRYQGKKIKSQLYFYRDIIDKEWKIGQSGCGCRNIPLLAWDSVPNDWYELSEVRRPSHSHNLRPASNYC